VRTIFSSSKSGFSSQVTTHEHELRTAGLRVTQGRIAVLDVLEEEPHASADSVLELVSRRLPNASPQTVYNVLNDLSRTGLVRRFEPAGSPALYERRIGDNHHHLVCTGCGTVADVDCTVGAAPCLTPADDRGFLLRSAEVTFWGLCPACRALSETA
jgi:Fe2+ or Zn2+ uptake regulation protein